MIFYIIIILLIIIIVIYIKYKEYLYLLLNYLVKFRNPKSTIEFHNNYARITYYIDHVPHHLRVPYKKLDRFKFHRMELIKGVHESIHESIGIHELRGVDGTTKMTEIQIEDITHRPGIPYFLTAEQMGGIQINHYKATELIKSYEINQIPSV